MGSETWHLWLLYRPLFVFLMACPFLIAPALIAWVRQRRDEKRRSDAEATQRATISEVATVRVRGPVAPAKDSPFERPASRALRGRERLSEV